MLAITFELAICAAMLQRAEQAGKTLIVFSHYPMTEFYNGQSDAIAAQFDADSFQQAWRPADSVTNLLAATGLKRNTQDVMVLQVSPCLAARHSG
ncbi:hypothetical protein [Rheinheimera sp.]|uniref:hypothetical protein n=1 Tax=Rheinheimera sp. TaxID=1869214 RepID=UPI00273512A0|nr:hypothetical protein [Rheinheimera sp.]MDP2716424.1 hypothetical protein [Rheinheimera sp.]